MLRDHRTERAIIHWYSGPLDVLAQLVGMGYMFSVGVEVLYSDRIREVARVIPSVQLLTETDNPGGLRWLTDETGYPTIIESVVDELARIRDVPRASLVEVVRSNLGRLFDDDPHMEPWVSRLD